MTPSMISALEERVISFMQANYPTIPTIPSGMTVPKGSAMYARVWVMASELVTPAGVGKNAKKRNVGVLQVDVYGPKDEGAGETGDVAFAVSQHITRQDIQVQSEGLCVLKDAGVKDLGSEGEEHHQMVRVPYRYDFS